MKTRTLYEDVVKVKHTPRNGEVVQFKVDKIFCPMCEVTHENNTLCQQPMEGDCI